MRNPDASQAPDGLAIAAALTACKREQTPPATMADNPPAAPAHAFSGDINQADFAELVKTLASDAFEGRGPGTAGEEKTVEYIKEQMQRIGLQPGNGDSYFQDVPMVVTTANPATTLNLEHNARPASWRSAPTWWSAPAPANSRSSWTTAR